MSNATEASAILAREMAEAQAAEFPNAQVATYPTKFFLWDVYVYKGDPDGGNMVANTKQGVNPEYCANVYGASLVASILGAVETKMLCPLNPNGLQDGWQTNKQTPYCIFAKNGVKGAPVNAGFLLGYWTHGYPADLALQNAQAEVEGSFSNGQ